ncbi:hypothetical protein [Natronoglycomyces albus]|uniref:Uncharacterized protein n=1 Tax=Natronoglycomyces albus TaxID=2811108 RepID=A0A895XHJ1_9ACTN|nr:hypothetical protein [Natronoglycomyces albus]QSB04397.1 hypothetical protein JQS30_11405 [Natronoglycomyces albus]
MTSPDMNNYEVTDIHVASDYNWPVSRANDWGLLKLAGPVVGGETVTVERVGGDPATSSFSRGEETGHNGV